jgi:S1-C subfamily serine protease
MVRFAAAALLFAALLGPSARGADLVLLDFWSPHCGPCMQMKPTVRSMVDANYPVREIDVTRDPNMARQFHVERIPCFVMLVDGQEVDRVVGATNSDRLVQMFDRARVRLQSPDTRPPAATAQAMPWTGEATGQPAAQGTGNSIPVDPAIYAQPQADESQSILESPAKLLSATVRLHVEDPKGRSFGTGTIIDSRSSEALVITCGHLFRDSEGKGTVTVDLFEATPNGLRVVGQIPGQVISYDLDRDLALVSIRPNRAVSVAPVAPPRTPIARGDRAASIGCSNGQDPTVLATRITSLDRYQGPPNIEASGAPVEGRSGGGLFNSKGQLVGVCFAADHEGNEGLYAALESIHGELDRLGLKDVYAKASATAPTASPPVIRGQEPLQPVMPLPDNLAAGPAATMTVDPADGPTAAPQSLSATEQAAWEEIMSRAASHEVICIIRPKEPGGQSEMIMLDEVSPEFVRALAARKRAADASLTR